MTGKLDGLRFEPGPECERPGCCDLSCCWEVVEAEVLDDPAPGPGECATVDGKRAAYSVRTSWACGHTDCVDMLLCTGHAALMAGRLAERATFCKICGALSPLRMSAARSITERMQDACETHLQQGKRER